jgi:hypothetical protein
LQEETPLSRQRPLGQILVRVVAAPHQRP